MIRLVLMSAVGVALTHRLALASTILPYFPYGTYQLSASPSVAAGTFQPDTAPSLSAETASGFALGALDFMMTSRSSTIGLWAGAKSLNNSAMEGAVVANAGIVAIPDEGERSGDPVTLYVHLVTRAYESEVAYGQAHAPAPLSVEARVRPTANLPWQSFSGPGIMPIVAVIGSKIELSLNVRAAAGDHTSGPFDPYAAIDLLLLLSYDTNPPADLLPREIVPGDATLDGTVDGADYTVWADRYLQTATQGALQGDFSHNGIADGGDYTIWADHYSPAPPSSGASAVPEPPALVLGVAGAAAFLASRRRRARTSRSASQRAIAAD